MLDFCCVSIGDLTRDCLVFLKDRQVSDFGCFVVEIWVLGASVFVFECFVFETTSSYLGDNFWISLTVFTPCFINPCFITTYFINPCFINPVHVLPIQSSPCFITCLYSDHEYVKRQQQNTTVTLQTKPAKSGNTDCRLFSKVRTTEFATKPKRSKFTLKIICFDATIGSKNHTIGEINRRSIFPMDWGQLTSLFTVLQSALFYDEQFRKPIMCGM